jgi:hypothetical protein
MHKCIEFAYYAKRAYFIANESDITYNEILNCFLAKNSQKYLIQISFPTHVIHLKRFK